MGEYAKVAAPRSNDVQFDSQRHQVISTIDNLLQTPVNMKLVDAASIASGLIVAKRLLEGSATVESTNVKITYLDESHQ